MNDQELYEQLVSVMEDLPFLVVEARRQRGLSQEQASIQMNVPQSTLSRLQHEPKIDMQMSTVLKILRWLAGPQGERDDANGR